MEIEVFISHSHKDANLAECLVTFLIDGIGLKKGDIRCTSHIYTCYKTGVAIYDQLRKDIQDCRIFLPLITSNIATSQFTAFEIGAAWALESVIFPVVVGPIKQEGMPVILAATLYCDCTTQEGLEKLGRDLVSAIWVKKDRPPESQIVDAAKAAMEALTGQIPKA